MINTVLFRVNASHKIGMGHFKRCLAVAHELKVRGVHEITFLMSETSDTIVSDPAGFVKVITKDNSDALSERDFILGNVPPSGKTALIIDSYEDLFYEDELQQEILSSVDCLVHLVFKKTEWFYRSHILHNQNPLGTEEVYHTSEYTTKLLGLEYVLLNPRIRHAVKIRRDSDRVRNQLLLTFGGSDPNQLTVNTLRALGKTSNNFDMTHIVLGGLFRDDQELELALDGFTDPFTIHRNINYMDDLMLKCRLAIVSGGTTVWELGALSVPVIAIPAGDVEWLSGKYLAKHGLVEFIDRTEYGSVQSLSKKLESLINTDLSANADRLAARINPEGVAKLVDKMLYRA